jgi:hypothetical protein
MRNKALWVAGFCVFYLVISQFGFSMGPNSLSSTIHVPQVMQIFISVIVLLCSLFVVLSKQYEPVEKHWAFGMIGTIVGFWLRVSA